MITGESVKKVLVLGSGALRIGQAGEFDYSGSQCIKALKEEGIEAIVINPNIATVQTSRDFADKVYFLPITPHFVEKVIEKEKPDAIMLAFGGQTALNCGIALSDGRVLEKHGVKVLGTPVEAIRKTEDRELFKKELEGIGVKVPESIPCTSEKEVEKAAKKIGFPVILRAAFTLGGQGSGMAYDQKKLAEISKVSFSYSDQVLVEEYLAGWKEIEYEVVRDRFDNCITVCNMENFDPLGIHTGESIVVAPSQTLTNAEYHKLREISLKVIRHFGIVGECNIQFALDPGSEDYRVIEVNARLSRSSALASKATGYPLAFIAAKLGLGHCLTEIKNSITKKTMACFEPALDYCVVKIPRWDLQKFPRVSTNIGSEMKSVGEVMAIGRKFEEALQKAVRMLNIGMYGVVGNKMIFERVSHSLKNPTDKRLFAVIFSLRQGYSVDKIYSLTGIDKWFLFKLENIVGMEEELRKSGLEGISAEAMLKAKQLGFSDKQIAIITGKDDEIVVRNARKKLCVLPGIKQIDTLAAEFPAETNYLYSTYNGNADDIKFDSRNSVIVLGSGAYSIGSSVEFDWCCVSSIRNLKKLGYSTTIINFNPETVSTDYDICDRLYFEELSLERVLDIYEKEKPLGIIVSMGGQIPNNLAKKLAENGVNVLGTPTEKIDNAEDRHKFSSLCDELGIDQPEWEELTREEEALAFSKKAGFPVLVRPSYVLSGAAMSVAFNEADLKEYLEKATSLSSEYPVVISKFILNAREIEVDAVAKNGRLLATAITEHVENAGTHSGDATIVMPPQKTYIETIRQAKQIAQRIAEALQITGPFNIQFIAKNNKVRVIECNLRASRSFPFVSKVSGTDFAGLAATAIMKSNVLPLQQSLLELDHVGVKAAQFSFSRLKGADPISGVEMASTGEVGCLGKDLDDALLKAMLSTGQKIPEKSILVSVSGDENRFKLLDSLKALLKKRAYRVYATDNTAKFLKNEGIECKMLHKVQEKKKPNVKDYLSEKKIDMVINVPDNSKKIDSTGGAYLLRRATVDFNVPLITNLQIAKQFIDAIAKMDLEDIEIKSWDEYVR